MTHLTSSLPLDALAARCVGRVTTPADAAYDEARQAWNLAVDQRPLAIVHAEGTADLVAAVRFAAEHGLRVAPQATGHGAGALGPVDDAILVRTDRMRAVIVDPVARTARIAAGAQWNDVLAQTAPHGLAPLAGSAGDVGVVGFHLGGGLSFLSRRHGLAARHLLGATVVLPDGSLHRATAEEQPELLWALRGGSGAFGVVAEIEIALHAVPELSTGQLFWPIERAGEILRAWRDWCATAPDSITTSARLLRFPPDPMLPEPLRGQAFVVVDGAFLGPEELEDELLQPLRDLDPAMDMFGPSSIAQLTELHMDPPNPMPSASSHVLLGDATDAVIDRLLEIAGPGADTALVMVELRQLGGALARGGDGIGATDGIEAAFALFAVGVPGVVPAQVLAAQLEGIVAAAGEQAAGTFANFTEQPGGHAPATPKIGARLARLRAELDPAGVMLAVHAPA